MWNKSFWKALEYARDGMFVPAELTNEMLDKVSGDKVLVLYSFEMLPLLHERGYTDVVLVTDNPKKYIRNLVNKYGYEAMSMKELQITMEKGMKFDVGITNPPYSSGQGNKLLYPDFFELCLDNCEQVISVMPIALETRSVKLKSHNERILRHNTHISEDVSHHFAGVSVGRISYVIASKSVENEFVPISDRDPYEDVALLFPERNRITSLKSAGGTMFGKYPTSKTVEVIQKVHKGGQLVTYKEEVSNISKWKAKSNSPWLLLLNHTPSKGKFNYQVVKNDGSVAFGNWVHAIEVRTKKDGIRQGEFLQTEKVCAHVRELLQANNNTHTASRMLVGRLPWFE